jgi:hypothetical protein
MRTLVSFDIDGTMEMGDPPGPISVDLVRTAQSLGYLVGSASDRTASYQRGLWSQHGIEVDFVGGKHHLPAYRDRWECERLIHIGDTEVDRHFANLAGFEFVFVHELPAPGTVGWIF